MTISAKLVSIQALEENMLKPTFTWAHKGNLSRPLAAMFLTDQIRLIDLCRRATWKYSCEFSYN